MSHRIKDFPTERSFQLIKELSVEPEKAKSVLNIEIYIIAQDGTDGPTWTLYDTSIIHMRSSGNAPELRCYVEEDTEPKTIVLLNKTLKCVQALA